MRIPLIMEPEVTPTFECTGCGKTVTADGAACRLCPACREELDQWLARTLGPACKAGEDPLRKLYCWTRTERDRDQEPPPE